MKRFLCLLALILSISMLQAQPVSLQIAGRLSPPVSGTFPLALVLQAAESAAHATGIWQPDWPFQLPPDAFRVNSGDIARITLAGDGIYLVLSHDEKGRPVDFPFMLNGNLAQVGITFHNGEIYRMTVSFPPSKDAWELEFLDHDGSYYALVRVFAGNTWYFIRLSRWAAGITELWFDVEGTLLGGYSYALATVGTTQKIRSIRDFLNPDAPGMDSYFDSWGLPTRISGPGGLHTVLRYRDALPRFWERQTPSGTGHFYLQWDANDLLFRMAPQSAGATAGQPAEYRFEYTLDGRGNWIQRRELRMFPHSGYLFPAPGAVFQRTLEYRHP